MIQIALIGCDHATADYGQLASRLQGARLAAVVDPDAALAHRTAEELSVPLRATSFEKLLRDNADAFDAVVIRRPSDSPQSVVEQAAHAGKHVLLDMSLLTGMPSGDASIAGVTFMPGQVTRFLPSVAEVKSCLESGVLGAPGLLRLHDWRAPDAHTTATLFEALLPNVDLANWLFGALPTEVYAAGHKQIVLTPFLYVQVHLGYPDGGMALIDCSRMLPSGSDYFALSVVGSSGAAYADDHHDMHLLYRGGRPTALPTGRGTLHYVAELQEFVDAIETGRPPAVAADDGHKAAEVVRAVDRSIESGRAMRLMGGCYEFA